MLYQQTIQAPLPVQSFLSNSCIQSQREEPAEILPARDSGALDDTHAHTCAWIIWSICWTSVNNQIVDGLNIVICCAVLCCLHNIYSHVTVFIEKSSFQWVRKKKSMNAEDDLSIFQLKSYVEIKIQATLTFILLFQCWWFMVRLIQWTHHNLLSIFGETHLFLLLESAVCVWSPVFLLHKHDCAMRDVQLVAHQFNFRVFLGTV